MLRIHPFAAIRPVPQRAAKVASVPYDVINTDEAHQLAEGNPDSFLHVVRSEIDLPEDIDPYDERVYRKAKENLERLIADGTFVQDDEPTMYLYRQVMNHRAQVGLVCCCHVEDYENDIIKKHEKTRPDKEDDRTRHVLTLNANAEPVLLTYRHDADIERLMEDDMNERPLYHFNATDGVTHTVWKVSDPHRYVDAMGRIDAAYIADGHHRSASAARAGVERREANSEHTGDEQYNWFLAVLFPDQHLHILPYNRVVKDLNGKSADELLNNLAKLGELRRQSGEKEPQDPGTVCIYLDGQWHTLKFDPATIDPNDPIGSLDVSLVQDRVLNPLLGIDDPRTNKRIDFVGGIRGTKELEDRVNSGRDAIAFSLYPTTIEQLLAVSDAGLVMPPKSTWFEPKLRSGLFVHMLDDDRVAEGAESAASAGKA